MCLISSRHVFERFGVASRSTCPHCLIGRTAVFCATEGQLQLTEVLARLHWTLQINRDWDYCETLCFVRRGFAVSDSAPADRMAAFFPKHLFIPSELFYWPLQRSEPIHHADKKVACSRQGTVYFCSSSNIDSVCKTN